MADRARDDADARAWAGLDDESPPHHPDCKPDECSPKCEHNWCEACEAPVHWCQCP